MSAPTASDAKCIRIARDGRPDSEGGACDVGMDGI